MIMVSSETVHVRNVLSSKIVYAFFSFFFFFFVVVFLFVF